jgi:hypothetical protein
VRSDGVVPILEDNGLDLHDVAVQALDGVATAIKLGRHLFDDNTRHASLRRQ